MSIQKTHKKRAAKCSTAVPLDSATVILVRDSSQGQYRIFLMRRHRGQEFMGGAYVFPGGRLDKADCDPALVSHVRGLTASKAKQLLQEPDLAEDVAMGLFFAALREMFEEAGVLLACSNSGEPISFSEGETAGRFASYRLTLHDRESTLKELACRESILYTLDQLLPYSHWVTPDVEPKRFNTRFFLAPHPKGQIPFHDTIEMTKSLWISPAEALEQHREGRILLMPPTLKTIEELNAFNTWDQLFSAAVSRQIEVILPQAYVTDDGFGVKLPHDPEYTLEGYKQPPRSGDPSRIFMKRGGRWETQLPDIED